MHADLSFITSGKVAAIVGGQRLAPMRRGQFFGKMCPSIPVLWLAPLKV